MDRQTGAIEWRVWRAESEPVNHVFKDGNGQVSYVPFRSTVYDVSRAKITYCMSTPHSSKEVTGAM